MKATGTCNLRFPSITCAFISKISRRSQMCFEKKRGMSGWRWSDEWFFVALKTSPWSRSWPHVADQSWSMAYWSWDTKDNLHVHTQVASAQPATHYASQLVPSLTIQNTRTSALLLQFTIRRIKHIAPNVFCFPSRPVFAEFFFLFGNMLVGVDTMLDEFRWRVRIVATSYKISMS